MLFKIPVSRLEELRKKLAKIEKKAPGTITYKELDTSIEIKRIMVPVFNGKYTELAVGDTYGVKCIEVDVEGNYIINGWEFIATLEHKDAGNIIRSANSFIEVPSRFNNCKCYCEHCKTIRNRKDTYIIRNTKTNEFKQIGSNCLMEYTCGLDSKVITGMMSFIDEVIEQSEIDEELLEYLQSNRDYGFCYKSDRLKKIAYNLVNKKGYINNSNAHQNGVPSTMDLFIKAIRENNVYGEASEEEINEVTEWSKTLNRDDQFYNNIFVLWNSGYIELRDVSLLLSMLSWYFKDLADKKAKELRSQNNIDYLGNVGDKVEFEVVSDSILFPSYGQFGISYTHKIIDKNGLVIIWRTGDKEIKKGNIIRASVKAQKEYKGRNGIEKQTEITRGKIIA